MNNRHRQIEKAEQMRYLNERRALRPCADLLISIGWDALNEAFHAAAVSVSEAMLELARRLRGEAVT